MRHFHVISSYLNVALTTVLHPFVVNPTNIVIFCIKDISINNWANAVLLRSPGGAVAHAICAFEKV